MTRILTDRRCLLIVLLLLTLFLSVPVLEHPPARDQGIFTYIGWRWLDGQVPYREGGADIKCPGIYLIYALALRLFGISTVSVRIADVLWRLLSVTALLVFLLAVYRRVNLAVWVAGLFYSLIGTLTYTKYWSSAQTESFMELPLIICFLAVYRALGADGRRQGAWMVASGLACGAATSIKLTGLFPLGALIPYFTTEMIYRRMRPTRVVQLLLLFLAGLALAVMPFLVYFAAHGALRDMVDIVWTFNRYYMYQTPLRAFVTALYVIGASLGPGLILFDLWYVGSVFGASVILFETARTEPRMRLMIWWLLAAYLSVSLQGKFFHYHWIIIAAPLSMLAGHGIDSFVAKLTPLRDRLSRAVGVALLVVGLFSSLSRSDPWQISVFVGRRLGFLGMAELKANLIMLSGDYDYDTDVAVASYLAAHTTPDDCVLVWGYEPLIYFLARRAACTRYIFDFPLTSQYAPDSWLAGTRSIFLTEINAAPPAYIAVAHDDINTLESQDSAAQLAQFRELAELVARDYCQEALIGNFDLYRRCQTGAD